MALLNFANTYAEISGNLSLPESTSGDFVKLFFSKDGHIISHGKDFTPTFTPNMRGLVPISSGKATEIFRGNATWAEITTADLPIASSISDAITNGTASTTILNTQQIVEYVGNAFAANDAMRYKGTITYSNGSYTTHTVAGVEVQGFPTKCEVGDTYRVTSQGTYAGQTCSAGDLLICIQDGTGSGLNTAAYWTAVEANINGQVKHTVNGTSIYVYSNSTNTFTIYAPTTGGTQGQVLLSKGSAAPTWAAQSTLVVGEAKKVSNALSLGAGLTFGTAGVTYNGSAARTISLVAATTTTIGGVIVDKDSTNKTISVTSAGSIYLTKQNVINALGYDPASKDTWRPITIDGVSIGEKTLNFVPSGDVYLKADSNGDDIQDISFGISWYNISTKKYETDIIYEDSIQS